MELRAWPINAFAQTFSNRLPVVWESESSVTLFGARGGVNALHPAGGSRLVWLCVRGRWDGTYFAPLGERDFRQVKSDEAAWRLAAAQQPGFAALVREWDIDRDSSSLDLARSIAPKPYRGELTAGQVRHLVSAMLR